VVTDASALFLKRRALLAAVDGAALAGAQGVDERAVYTGGAHGSLPLDARRVEEHVDAYITAADLYGQFDNLQIESVTVDGDVVNVELSAEARLPFVHLFAELAGRSVHLDVHASARSAVVP
jgi:hypothetical protein